MTSSMQHTSTHPRLARRLRDLALRPGMPRAILANAASLMATQGITSGLGVVFWGLAAHHFSRAAVGLAGGAVSAMTLLGTLATLGFGTALIGELPRRRSGKRALVWSAAVVCSGTGAVLGVAFAVGAGHVSRGLTPLAETAGSVALFSAGVAITSMALVFDGATIGLLRGRLQLGRNVIFAAVKLVLLIAAVGLLSHRSGLGIFATWALGTLLSLVLVGGGTLGRGVLRLRAFRPRPSLLKGMWSQAFGHQAYNLSFTVPSFVLPLAVLTFVSAQANGEFYVAFMIAAFIFMIPNALTTVLFAVGAMEPDALAKRLRLTLAVSVATCLGAIVVIMVGAQDILGLFGDKYAGAAWTLRTLTLAALPLIVKTHFLAVTRILRQLRQSMPIVWSGAVLEVIAGAVGAIMGGIEGVSIGWLIALTLEACVMSRTVVPAARTSA